MFYFGDMFESVVDTGDVFCNSIFTCDVFESHLQSDVNKQMFCSLVYVNELQLLLMCHVWKHVLFW